MEPTKCICIDVDDTLITKAGLNVELSEWALAKKDLGFEVYLWSARGKAHAERVATVHKITHHFTAIISKPGYIVDDQGWSWTRFTKVLSRLF